VLVASLIALAGYRWVLPKDLTHKSGQGFLA
jgi:hypothetical protein